MKIWCVPVSLPGRYVLFTLAVRDESIEGAKRQAQQALDNLASYTGPEFKLEVGEPYSVADAPPEV